MDNYIKQAHALWREGRELEALDFLKEAVNICRKSQDKYKLIELLNEYGGALRVVGYYDQGIAAIGEAKKLCEENSLEATEGYATTVMNLANIYREKEQLKEAEYFFEESKKIFKKLGISNYSYVGLLNNYALLMQTKLDYVRANEMQLEAISILSKDDSYMVPLAISYNNLYEIQKKLNKTKSAKEYLQKARDIISKKLGENHPLYAAVLNNLADFNYNNANYEEAIKLYENALEIIVKTYGVKSSPYKSIMKNIELTKSYINPDKKKLIFNSQGLKLSYQLYEKVIVYIESNYPDIYKEICIGLVGKGSECYGYDDELSKDHDFETRCMIFLKKDTYQKYKDILQSDLNVRYKEKIEIYSIDNFYKFYTSFERGPITITDFRKVDEEYLSTATNGYVFIDNLGEFTAIRTRLLEHYPKDLYFKKMALYLNNMAQSGQYNYPRILKRGDIVGAQAALQEFIKYYIYFIHLINKKYTPFYKWSFRSCMELRTLGQYSERMLNKLVAAKNSEKEKIISEICSKIVKYLNTFGYSNSEVDFLTYQANEVAKNIEDVELSKLNLWGR